MAKNSPPQKSASSKPGRVKESAKQQDLGPEKSDGMDEVLTSNQGLAINDNHNSLKRAGSPDANVSAAFIEAIAAHRHWDREADPLTGEVG